MIDLKSLRYHQDHPCRPIFLGYDWRACAKRAGVKYGLFVDILNGDIEPSPENEKRIQRLADSIEVEETIGFSI